jgi:hypothetical protein
MWVETEPILLRRAADLTGDRVPINQTHSPNRKAIVSRS